MEKSNCDGLFVHPIIGKKKSGDFKSKIIVSSYEIMQKYFYPNGKVLFGVFSTYSRYAGQREAVFTALCRKNFGCSHFIVGRDHTGIGNKTNKNDVFSTLPDLGIKIIKFDNVFYSKDKKEYVEEDGKNSPKEKIDISGTKIRDMFIKKIAPPAWFIRSKISKMIIKHLESGEDIFVE